MSGGLFFTDGRFGVPRILERLANRNGSADRH